MRICVIGAGVQGSLFATRLSAAGHEVIVVARGRRAAEIAACGLVIAEASGGAPRTAKPAIVERLTPERAADLAIVAVRREQFGALVPELRAAAIPRLVLLLNDAFGFSDLEADLPGKTVVRAFPGFSGRIEEGVDRYLAIPQQPTVVDARAADIVALFRRSGITTKPIRDMRAWLSRHAVFILAISGAYLKAGASAASLARRRDLIAAMIAAVREGWQALDRRGVAPAPVALRAIFTWVPKPFAIAYWRNLIAQHGEDYFGQYIRAAPEEFRFLAGQLRSIIADQPATNLRALLSVIDADVKVD